MEESNVNTSGHRGNLTSSQTRDLFQLWHRFLQLCEDHPYPATHSVDQNNLNTPTAASNTPPSTSDSIYLQSNRQTSQIPVSATHNASLSPPIEPLDATSLPSTAPSSANASGEKLPGGTEDGGQTHLPNKRSINDLSSNLYTSQNQASSGIHHNQRSFSSRVSASAATRRTLPRSASVNLDRASASASASAPHSHQPNSAALGRNIPRDDRVKDQVRGLEEAKELRNFLLHHGGIKLKEVFWSMVKGEHPDAYLLRILRARKWDVDRALGVIGSTAAFRLENDVVGINFRGEESLFQTKGGQKIYRNGIAYVWGATSLGEPIYYIEVGNHFGSNQTQEELKKAIILSHEHLVDLMPPPVEKCVVVFNMNHFGLRNMDWWTVFFLVKTVEAYYPESLTRIYVHGAPWFFKPIWIILRPLLDPIVRDKVRLTSSVEELEEHIPWTHLPKNSMYGGMEWDYVYPEPEEDENHLLRDSVRREHLQASFNEVASEFESTTRSLLNAYVRARTRIRNRGPQSSASRNSSHSRRRNQELDLDSDAEIEGPDRSEGGRGDESEDSDEELDGNDASSTPSTTRLLARRDVLATKLRVAWLELRPYIWAKSKYDRWGITQEDGTIKWTYPGPDGQDEVQILGEGVSIPELKRGLEIIERSQQENNDAMIAEATSSSKGSTARRREASNGLSASGPASSTAPGVPTIARPSRASQKRSRIAATLAAAQAHPSSQLKQNREEEDDARSSLDENENEDENEGMDGRKHLAFAAAAAAAPPSSSTSTDVDPVTVASSSNIDDMPEMSSSNIVPASPTTNGSGSVPTRTSANSESTVKRLSNRSEAETSPLTQAGSSSVNHKRESSTSSADRPIPVHPLEAARLARAE